MNKTVLLIDKNPIFSNGVTRLLENKGFNVLATTSDSATGLELAAQLTPQVILLDTGVMPADSLVLLKQLQQHNPDAKIALLAWQTNSNQLKHALQEGVHGYLARDIEPDELIRVLGEMVLGKIVVPPELASILTRFQRTRHNAASEHAPPELIARLTPREYETLLLLTKGLNNKMIARHMGLTEGTVKNHVKAILSKLNVDTRINAAVLALAHGIGTEPE